MTIEVVVGENQHEQQQTEYVYMPPPELMIGDSEHPPQIITAARQRLSLPEMDMGKLSGLLTVDGPEALYRVQKGIIPDAIVVNIDGVFWSVDIVDNYIYFKNKDKTLTYGWLNQSGQGNPSLEIDKKIADRIESAWGGPRSPWGPRALMDVDFDRIHAFYDAAGPRLKNNYAMRAGVVEHFMQNRNIPNTTTLWGQCHGVGDPTGVNAMSLNYNHGVVSETGAELTPDYVKTIRLHSPFDMGISEEFAKSQLSNIKTIVQAFGGSDIKVTSDRMGIVFVLPGFHPLDMAKADYVNLERSVGLCIHEGLRNQHRFFYGSEYNDTIIQVDKAHRDGINDKWWGEFNGIFQPQNFDKRHGFSEETYKKLMYLYNNNGIKKPFGWAYSLGFNNDECVGAITWAVRNAKGIGANEGLGALSNRINEYRSDQENATLKLFYVSAVKAGLTYSAALQ